jgi:hypothetical protein
MDVTRVEVPGWPAREVAELDHRLSKYAGGAQLWQIVDTPRRTAVGVLYPTQGRNAERCRKIVRDWQREHNLD